MRSRLVSEVSHVVQHLSPKEWNRNSNLLNDPKILTQYVLDCTSPNLPKSLQVPPRDSEKTISVFKVTRDFCFAIHKERMRQLKLLKT